MNDKSLKMFRKILLLIAVLTSFLGSVYMYLKDAKMIAFCFVISSILLLINFRK